MQGTEGAEERAEVLRGVLEVILEGAKNVRSHLCGGDVLNFLMVEGFRPPRPLLGKGGTESRGVDKCGFSVHGYTVRHGRDPWWITRPLDMEPPPDGACVEREHLNFSGFGEVLEGVPDSFHKTSIRKGGAVSKKTAKSLSA